MKQGLQVFKLGTTLFVGVLIFLTTSTAVAAADPHGELRTLVEDYLEDLHDDGINAHNRIEVSVGYIDPRLRLPGCDQPLQLSLNGSQQPIGKLQVQVLCAGTAPWKKFVPAEVKAFQPILVANGNIPRGTLLDLSHFSILDTDIASLRRTPISDPETAIGMELKYSLTAGAAISQEILQKPKVVKRGDLVQLVAETDSLLIRQQGEALQDGEVGKLINVRNNSSRLVVQAMVVSTGKVKVQL